MSAASATQQQWSKVKETHSGYQFVLGPTNADRLIRDPKCFGFFLSRYKFAAKMLRASRSILDVGCGDGVGTLMLLNETDAAAVVGVDFDEDNIRYANETVLPAIKALRPQDEDRGMEFLHGDLLESPRFGFDGLVCMDVIEHIEPSLAGKFINHLSASLLSKRSSMAVIGTPSLASAPFASEHSRVGHINLYEPDRLRSALENSFSRVLMFSMNDEIVHTGFDKLAHYLLAVCIK